MGVAELEEIENGSRAGGGVETGIVCRYRKSGDWLLFTVEKEGVFVGFAVIACFLHP